MRIKSSPKDHLINKAMYNTVNDGFYRKQSQSPSPDEDRE